MYSQEDQPNSRFRLARNVAVESFGDKCLVLLADRDTFITLNNAAYVLLDLVRVAFGDQGFSRDDLSELMHERYDLDMARSRAEAEKVLASWLEQSILQHEENV